MSSVVITGASRGIGLELCKYYVARERQVYAVCRTSSPELIASGASIIQGIDVASSTGIADLQEALHGKTIELLINNAGVFENNALGNIDYDSLNYQFQVNAIAPLRVTEALLHNLGNGAKIALITSRMGSMGDNTSGAYYGYRMSKAALNAAGVSLARDLKPRAISVAILHPGFVQTQMVGFAGDITAAVAAERLAARITELDLDNSGSFWHSNGDVLPW
jgi:NAD(P)-dependent dehydrogenase (short-subunit alcohol dehydrogenase family)